LKNEFRDRFCGNLFNGLCRAVNVSNINQTSQYERTSWSNADQWLLTVWFAENQMWGGDADDGLQIFTGSLCQSCKKASFMLVSLHTVLCTTARDPI
jgi:hypothetical protein